MRKTVVYKSNFRGMFMGLLIFMTALLVWGIKEKGDLFGLFVIGIFMIVVLRFLSLTPHTVIIQANAISEFSFLHKKTFEASQVEKIIISPRIISAGGRSRLHNYIEIHTNSEHVISFEYFYGKSPDVYEILQGWHNKHKSHNLPD